MADFNIDSGGLPVTVKLRGKNYKLGGTALELLDASEMFQNEGDAEGNVTTRRVLEMLPDVLAKLCPSLPTDLNATEQLSLVSVVTEVLRRMGGSFSPETG